MSTAEQQTIERGFSVGAVARDVEGLIDGTGLKGRDLYEALHGLDTLEFTIRKAREAIVAELRQSGATWEGIGEALGVSRQAAHERYASATRG
jgi:hypothetical protein